MADKKCDGECCCTWTPQWSADRTSWAPQFTMPQEVVLDMGSEVIVTPLGDHDYETAKNKPRINDVELVGNKTSEDLDIMALTNTEIENLLKNFI